MKTIIMLGKIPLFLLVTPVLANAQVGTWTYYNSTSGESGQIIMTTANSDHIEFKDIHGNTISLRGGNMTGMRMGASAMNDTQRYNSGFAQGLAGMKMKGHHTEAFLNGYNDGKLQREDKIAQQNPAKYGYSNGVADGQKSARDSTSACSPYTYNSTSIINECFHGYDLGFKKGCEWSRIHDPSSYNETDGEYPSCYSFYHSK